MITLIFQIIFALMFLFIVVFGIYTTVRCVKTKDYFVIPYVVLLIVLSIFGIIRIILE